jgi:hypothetical protein
MGLGAFSIQLHAPESIKMLYLHWIRAFYRFHETIKRSGAVIGGLRRRLAAGRCPDAAIPPVRILA